MTNRTLSQVSSEERLKFEKAILEQALDAIVTIDDDDVIVEWNAVAEEIFQYKKEEIIGKNLYTIMPLEYRAGHRRGMDHWRKTKQGPILGKRIEVEAIKRDGTRFPIELAVSRPFTFKNEVYFTSRIRDISERKLEEELAKALIFELDHRVKNTLAIVTAILRLTKSSDVNTYKNIVEKRILSLANVHTLLADNKWEGVGVCDIIKKELSAVLTTKRFTLNGFDFILNPVAAQAFGIVLHELFTNAVSHGSLSSEVGNVNLTWKKDTDGVHFFWSENLGPEVIEPIKKSFGLVMIESHFETVMKKKGFIEWNREGFCYNFIIPDEFIITK